MFGYATCAKSHLLFAYKPLNIQRRTFWEYVNMMFNRPDPDRIKMLGPDRACAEWVLRNGGKVVWADGKQIDDYNLLPPEDRPVPKIVEIDATDSGISHYGFSHLKGCTMIRKFILHNNTYIEDKALKGLSHAKDSLVQVQVSKCAYVTDNGVKELKALHKLENLVVYNLDKVTNLNECAQFLKKHLPNCTIEDFSSDIKEK